MPLGEVLQVGQGRLLDGLDQVETLPSIRPGTGPGRGRLLLDRRGGTALVRDRRRLATTGTRLTVTDHPVARAPPAPAGRPPARTARIRADSRPHTSTVTIPAVPVRGCVQADRTGPVRGRDGGQQQPRARPQTRRTPPRPLH
ncbi:hypothetical protein ACWC5I_48570, partial [Kitasatospora sp. NPDC001574]